MPCVGVSLNSRTVIQHNFLRRRGSIPAKSFALRENLMRKLNERALRYIYSDRSSTYAGESTEGTSYTLADRRIQDMLILVFKAVNNLLPTYLSDLFIIRENIKNLRGTNKLVIPNVNTTRYGTKSVAFTAPKAWNSLPDRLSLKDFKIAVRSM